MSRFTTESIKKYRETFDVFDTDKDGVISTEELRNVSWKLGYRLSEEQIQSIMHSRDLDNSGTLSFEEFLKAMPGNVHEISVDEHKQAEVRLKFLEYDKDGNGLVSVQEAHEILEKELAFTPSQTIALLKRYDRNNDGHLSYEEFVGFYRRVKSRRDEIQRLFNEFDSDRDGHITMPEVKAMLARLGLFNDDVEILVTLHDKNKDGKLSYEEFVHFLMDGE